MLSPFHYQPMGHNFFHTHARIFVVFSRYNFRRKQRTLLDFVRIFQCKQTVDKSKQTADQCEQRVDQCKQIDDKCKQIDDKCKQIVDKRKQITEKISKQVIKSKQTSDQLYTNS